VENFVENANPRQKLNFYLSVWTKTNKMGLDVGDTLNLICKRNTGSYLPSGWFGANDWMYKIVDGKKIAVHKSLNNRITNPFQHIGCDGDFILDIKRRIVVDDLKHEFAPAVNIWAFFAPATLILNRAHQPNLMPMWDNLDEVGKTIPDWVYDGIEAVIPDAYQFVLNSDPNQQGHRYWTYLSHDDKRSINSLNGIRIRMGVCDKRRMIKEYLQPILIFVDEPVRDYIINWFTRENKPTKIDKIRQGGVRLAIHNRDYDDNPHARLYKLEHTYDNQSQYSLECEQSSVVRTKKDYWIPYFWITVAQSRDDDRYSAHYYHLGRLIKDGFSRRKNSWQFIKDNSPRLATIEQDHPKEDWQKRHFESLITY
jgi:hypothetical protein